MSNVDPSDIGVGNPTNGCERSDRDKMLNAQFNPFKNVKECFGPVQPVNRTEHDLEQNAKFGCTSREGYSDRLSDDPFNQASFLIRR